MIPVAAAPWEADKWKLAKEMCYYFTYNIFGKIAIMKKQNLLFGRLESLVN